MRYLFFAIVLSSYLAILPPFPVHAQTCDTSSISSLSAGDLQAKIDKCKQAWNQMEAAKKPHVDALRKMEADIAAFQAQIKVIEQRVAVKAAAISEGERQLGGLLTVATRRIREFYMRSFRYNPFAALLSSTNIGEMLRTMTYQQVVINEDKKTITQIAISVKDLEDRKKALEGEQASLAYLKDETDKRAVAVRKLVAEANAFQQQVAGIIASLTARQQEFLGQKLAGLNIPRSALTARACIDDRPIDPGFSPRFAFFTFGVPNRVGLNQWGAKGRADAGQNYDQILRAYYNFDGYQNYDTNLHITVSGYGSYTLEDYMKRIYEVPGDWPIESLRAQAVAARSYALAYTNSGGNEICATEQCQVFKPDPKGGAWEQAVNDTAGKAMVLGGNPIKAWFSSTHGGYVFASGDLQGWSSTPWTKRAIDASSGINGFSDLFSSAYDRGSPWFYCDWGSRSQYNKTAWLKSDELADIVNVILLAKQDSSAQPHLVQPDKPNPDGVDTWDAGTVRSKLGSAAYNSINSISISFDSGTGRTSSVTTSGDGGVNTFDGSDFKTYFNLRAPSNIQIVGPLFNVEKR